MNDAAYTLWALDAPGGQGIVRGMEEWYLIDMATGWQPRLLRDAGEAMHWAMSVPAVSGDRAYSSIAEAQVDVRAACLQEMQVAEVALARILAQCPATVLEAEVRHNADPANRLWWQALIASAVGPRETRRGLPSFAATTADALAFACSFEQGDDAFPIPRPAALAPRLFGRRRLARRRVRRVLAGTDGGRQSEPEQFIQQTSHLAATLYAAISRCRADIRPFLVGLLAGIPTADLARDFQLTLADAISMETELLEELRERADDLGAFRFARSSTRRRTGAQHETSRKELVWATIAGVFVATVASLLVIVLATIVSAVSQGVLTSLVGLFLYPTLAALVGEVMARTANQRRGPTLGRLAIVSWVAGSSLLPLFALVMIVVLAFQFADLVAHPSLSGLVSMMYWIAQFTTAMLEFAYGFVRQLGGPAAVGVLSGGYVAWSRAR